MYDVKQKVWISDAEDADLLRWSQEEENCEAPEAMFLQASRLLSQYKRGSEAAQAVYLMETAAKADFPPAVFAMGQMFEYGIAVHRSLKKAQEYYRKALELEYPPAKQAAAEARRKRLLRIGLEAASAALLLLCILGGILLARYLNPRATILVQSGTQLSQPADTQAYAQVLRQLIEDNDTPEARRGEASTNRIILRFEGKVLNLQDFPAAQVVSRDDNLILIQFADYEEAQRCLKALQSTEGVVYAQMDEYDITASLEGDDPSNYDLEPKDTSLPYYSWGVGSMGLDKLAAWVGQKYPDRSIIVAVIDTGALVGQEFQDRVLPGYNVLTGGAPLEDLHGTHTVGTVLDGTRGANVQVLNIDVYNETGHGTISGAPSILHAGDSAVDLAIRYAMDAGAQVMSLSLGCNPHNAVFEDSMKNAVDAGIVMVKSAGNNDANNAKSSKYSCPAEQDYPLVVGAVDTDHTFANFTNYGPSTDVCAPGTEILSQFYMDEAQLVYLQGTSMATPHVAALAALVRLTLPDATPAQVELYIKDYCTDAARPGIYGDNLHGSGEPYATCFIEE